MELIRRTESRRDKTGKLRYYGMFKCPYCKEEVEKVVDSGKKSKSCGCYNSQFIIDRNFKHGGSCRDKVERLYQIWLGMKRRCCNKKRNAYSIYGGKGIIVCDEWINSYPNFKRWALENGYNDNLTIDREKSYKNYCPENCRWVTRENNARFKSSTKLNWDKTRRIRSLYENVKVTQETLSKIFNVKRCTISDVLRNKSWRV